MDLGALSPRPNAATAQISKNKYYLVQYSCLLRLLIDVLEIRTIQECHSKTMTFLTYDWQRIAMDVKAAAPP
eukprot:1418427-Heterocapsa_arctica.AAC.1